MTAARTQTETRWRGIAAAPGIAMGPAFVYRVGEEDPPLRHFDDGTSAESEWRRLDEALAGARGDLLALKKRTPGTVGSALGKIFDAEAMILDDEDIRRQVRQRIVADRLCAECAFAAVVGEAQRTIAKATDPYLREMANDIQAVKHRVINRLLGLPSSPDLHLDSAAVILAHTITPADIMGLTKGYVLGIVAETGGQTSHTALLAKSLGIPAVVGVKRDVRVVTPGTRVVVDGFSGVVIIEPRDATVEFCERKRKRTHSPWPRRLDALRDLPATTRDGHTVAVMANIDLAGESALAVTAGAAGVGLYRTEYLFLQRGAFPTEARQREVYSQAVTALGGRTLTVRTFDLGFDKAKPGERPEVNPALGVRGIRLAMERPGLLLSQFRALLAASALGPVWVMVPMVASVEEFVSVQALWQRAKSDLPGRGIVFDRKTKLGLMIETPAAVRMAPELAKLAGFFSIGSNDLAQYTTAVDRGNARLAHMQHHWHPALWRQMADVVKAGRRARIPVGICGEMAGDLLAIGPLIGLGFDSLSLHPNSVPAIKSLVRSGAFSSMRATAERILQVSTADQVRDLAKRFHQQTKSHGRTFPSRRRR